MLATEMKVMNFKRSLPGAFVVLAAVAICVLTGTLAKPKTTHRVLTADISLDSGAQTSRATAGPLVTVLGGNSAGSYTYDDAKPDAAASENLAFQAVANTNITMPAVPEPATWALLGLGVGAVGGALRSRRRSEPTAA
jgi:PEP-CTERM motif